MFLAPLASPHVEWTFDCQSSAHAASSSLKSAASGEGLDADFYVTNFSRNEANEEFIAYSVTAEPTDEERDPAWV